jgi:hypothetical protein
MSSRSDYTITDEPRFGVSRVTDAAGETMFVGVREDCEEWVSDPSTRPQDKPANYPFRYR